MPPSLPLVTVPYDRPIGRNSDSIYDSTWCGKELLRHAGREFVQAKSYILSNNIIHVEVPLDSRYLTDEGMYVAGYGHGQRGQSTNDWRHDAPDAPEQFHMGVADGYGDWLNTFKEYTDRQETVDKGIV